MKTQQKHIACEKSILSSLRGEVTPQVPFWFMRQAGRYMPEYRAVREKAGSFLNLCFTPNLAADVTLQPIQSFDMDAAILFSDILVLPHALGQTVSFQDGEGPVLAPLKSQSDIDRLTFDKFDEILNPVYETVGLVKQRLPENKTLIGFAGAPWTVACYMLQGRGGGDFHSARAFSYSQPVAFQSLINKITEATTLYLLKQIANGADVVQLFDSWAGLLPEPFFKQWVIEPTRRIVDSIREQYPEVPIIGFPRQAGSFFARYAAKTGVTGVGLDTQVPLSWALNEFNKEFCLQGNLDPLCLLVGGSAMEDEALRILELMKKRPFIFNLGHGIHKETPVKHVEQLVQIIKSFKR